MLIFYHNKISLATATELFFQHFLNPCAVCLVKAQNTQSAECACQSGGNQQRRQIPKYRRCIGNKRRADNLCGVMKHSAEDADFAYKFFADKPDKNNFAYET